MVMATLPLRRTSSGRDDRLACRSAYVVGLVFVLLALIAPGACLPHSHSGVGVGIYNEDHDLSILAASSTTAPLPASTPLFVDLVVESLGTSVHLAPVELIPRDAESRAPPAA